MEATIIYNSNARRVTELGVEELKDALLKAGYQPVYKATGNEEDLDEALADVQGLVLVAGGDGTVRAVAKRLINKPVSLAILPLGTANNISKSFGIEGEPLDIIARLSGPQKSWFDIGYVCGPWGKDYFFEGMGWGLFADALADYDPDEGKSILRGLQTTIRSVTHYEIYPTQMKLDGIDISGDYILVEILNTKAVGPRLQFAPNADPGDGLFDVVRIRADEDDGMLQYAINMFTEALEDLPSVELVQGRRLDVLWRNFPVHIDAEVRPEFNERSKDLSPENNKRPDTGDTTDITVTVEVIPRAIELWLPKP